VPRSRGREFHEHQTGASLTDFRDVAGPVTGTNGCNPMPATVKAISIKSGPKFWKAKHAVPRGRGSATMPLYERARSAFHIRSST
jgi:hypothetical protein